MGLFGLRMEKKFGGVLRIAALLMMLGVAFIPALAQDPPADAAPADAATADAAPTEEAPAPAPAAELSAGDTAWMLTSTALVLFMTIPGLALFYGGLVRTKNVLSVLMQCFALTAMVTIIWAVIGYSLAFDTTGPMNKYLGGFGKLFLKGVEPGSLWMTMPESVWIIYQLTFAIITPALIIGAFAERMKFSALLLFIALWSIIVYSPIAHMVWGGAGTLFGVGGMFGDSPALDFAGGTVVHINAGIAALVGALVLGKRKGYPETQMAPHNMTMCVTGASMLWVGWFGFNAGSAGAANASAGMAMAVTQIATAAAALTWMFIEWFKHGKPSALGLATGAVAGLVAITPASGTAGFMGAIAIGVAASGICFVASTSIKRALGYDDSLDAFGVHCVGGLVGAILTGVFASGDLGGQVAALELAGIPHQVFIQFVASAFTLVYSGVMSFILYKLVDVIVGLRVDEAAESEGLDLALHGEAGYNLN